MFWKRHGLSSASESTIKQDGGLTARCRGCEAGNDSPQSDGVYPSQLYAHAADGVRVRVRG